MKNIKFLGFGDITTDAFIELQDAKVNCDINRDACMLSMRFGDKIPFKDDKIVHAVGNSSNAAVSAKRFGLDSYLATYVGNDEEAEKCLSVLEKEGVNTKYVKKEEGAKTNYHYVLRYEEERTILVKHTQFGYELPDFEEKFDWVYLSSMAENSLTYHHKIVEWLKENSQTKLVFQPGTFQIELGYEKLHGIYQASEIFFCNKEEAQKILESKDTDIKNLLKQMHEKGPKIVIITDGPNGAYAYDGNNGWFMPMYPDPKPPVDRTGAGDSFSSATTAALAIGKTLPEALAIGPVNSMSVVQYIGAQEGLLTLEQIEKYLEEAPDDYKVEKII